MLVGVVQVQEACWSWLSEVASCCVSHGLALLQQCPDAASLLQAEAAVHTAMAEWTAAPEPDTTAQQDTAATAAKSRPSTAGSGAAGAQDDKQRSRLNRLGSAAAAAAVAGVSSTPPGSPAKAGVQRGRSVSDWELTCLAVLGHKVDLWQVGAGVWRGVAYRPNSGMNDSVHCKLLQCSIGPSSMFTRATDLSPLVTAAIPHCILTQPCVGGGGTQSETGK